MGVDATLDEIENLLTSNQWGSVYAFLIDKEGETIFHPLLKPSSGVYTQQKSYSISHLPDTVTTQWLDSDSVVTVGNCRHCTVTELPMAM